MNTQNKPIKPKEVVELSQEETIQNQPEIEALKIQIEVLITQLNDSNTKQMRTLADYQNLVRRVEKEKIDWIKFSNEGLLGKLLDIADNQDRAAIFINDQGLQMVRKALSQLLTEYSVKEIEVLGKGFDPNIMDCVDKLKGEANIVLEVKQKGYMLHEKVLRPAKVVVGEE